MNSVPHRTPRSGPNGAVTCMDLVNKVVAKILVNLQIDDQKMDQGPVVLALQKEVSWYYFALRTEVRKGFLLLAMFQAALVRRVLLTVCKSLIPSPLFSMGWQMSSQDLNAVGEVGLSS